MPSVKKALNNCPNCRGLMLDFDGIKQYKCKHCGWEFYQNTAAAVAAILEFEGKIIAVRRNREPGIGMLDFPGGFVDPDETLEEAVIREIREELAIEISQLRYLVSSPNRYVYKNIEYTTCDCIFTGILKSTHIKPETAEISEILFLDPWEINPEDFAFESMKKGLSAFLKKLSKA